MSIHGRFFAATYNVMMKRTERACLGSLRQQMLGDLEGEVLEIGAGTGHNLERYGSGVSRLVVAEPEPAMVRRLEKHVAKARESVPVLRAPAEDLPFADDTFDVVVSTLVLCTVDDAPRAVREIRRVLRPGGRFVFIEHVRSDDAKLARTQDRMNGLNRIVAYGCNCNRPTLDVIRAVGFDAIEVERGELLKAPPFLRPLVFGSAVVPAVVNH